MDAVSADLSSPARVSRRFYWGEGLLAAVLGRSPVGHNCSSSSAARLLIFYSCSYDDYNYNPTLYTETSRLIFYRKTAFTANTPYFRQRTNPTWTSHRPAPTAARHNRHLRLPRLPQDIAN